MFYQERVSTAGEIDQPQSSSNPYTDDQKLFRNMAIFDFETMCAQEDIFRDTDTNIWISKHVLISVSLLFTLIEQAILLCSSNPRDLD